MNEINKKIDRTVKLDAVMNARLLLRSKLKTQTF